jgi:hypothetical protein
VPYRVLADLVVLVHVGFVLFAVLGGLVVLWWRRVAWVHLPAALWAALIEFAGWVCPLTPLETWLRGKGGGTGYRGSFIEHHVLPIVYPDSLTRPSQVALGLFVLVVNLAVYGGMLRRGMKTKARGR